MWTYFGRILQLSGPPESMIMVWGSWRSSLVPSFRVMGNLVIKAIMWNIWLPRYDCIFNAIMVHVHILCLKINRMLLS